MDCHFHFLYWSEFHVGWLHTAYCLTVGIWIIKKFLNNLKLVWTQTCTTNQMSDTGWGKPVVIWMHNDRQGNYVSYCCCLCIQIILVTQYVFRFRIAVFIHVLKVSKSSFYWAWSYLTSQRASASFVHFFHLWSLWFLLMNCGAKWNQTL